MGGAATGEGKWRPVVTKVLPEGVPVPPFLVLVSARSG